MELELLVDGVGGVDGGDVDVGDLVLAADGGAIE
jgi:hypothetical protein